MRLLVLLAVAGLGCGCITTINVGQKTSLERQLMGEMEPLSEEEAMALSVRATGEIGTGSLDDLRQRALAARRRQLFNRDDIEEQKGRGCLGEGPIAQLLSRPCDAASDPEVAARIERLVQEENEDRQAIISWALAVDPVLTSGDREQIVNVYARLLRERAAATHWFQTADGEWQQKGSP